MPFYDYLCEKCGHPFDRMCRVAEREEPLKEPCENCKETGHIIIEIGAPGICDPIRMGRIKPSGEFKERMNDIKRLHPLGTYRD